MIRLNGLENLITVLALRSVLYFVLIPNLCFISRSRALIPTKCSKSDESNIAAVVDRRGEGLQIIVGLKPI